VVGFDDIRIGLRSEGTPDFSYPLPVPGRVELPGGLTLTAIPAAGPEAREAEAAVIEMPEEPLVVRTRLPGDRMRAGGHEVSLKRVLREERVPVDLRPALPLVASGSRVLWFPGPHPFSTIRGTLDGKDAVVSPPDRGFGRSDEEPLSRKSENEPRFVRLSIERS
jgi:tRNA(Ile)-lysidine synthetase-like protein